MAVRAANRGAVEVARGEKAGIRHDDAPRACLQAARRSPTLRAHANHKARAQRNWRRKAVVVVCCGAKAW